jgi:hypothetical protein
LPSGKNVGDITDVSIIKVAEGYPDLRILDLKGCKITDTCVIRLAEKCPKLRSLYMSLNDDITDTSIIRLAERCKKFGISIYQSVGISLTKE